MKNPIQLSASVMCADFSRLEAQFRELDAAGIDRYHWDVIDGHFAPNFGQNADQMANLRAKTKTPFEAHLMVEHPEYFINDFQKAGCQLIVVHQEVTIHLRRLIQQIRQAGCQAGVALNPITPLDALQHVLGDISQVLLMTVDAGFAAQPFARTVIPKIRQMRQMLDAANLDIEIAVDGGINPKTIPEVAAAGGNVLVLGSTGLFTGQDFQTSIRTVRQLAADATK